LGILRCSVIMLAHSNNVKGLSMFQKRLSCSPPRHLSNYSLIISVSFYRSLRRLFLFNELADTPPVPLAVPAHHVTWVSWSPSFPNPNKICKAWSTTSVFCCSCTSNKGTSNTCWVCSSGCCVRPAAGSAGSGGSAAGSAAPVV